MQKVAQLFIGEHDFAGFCSAKSQVQTTVRTIYRCEVEKMGHQICIRVTGSGFLYNMVRIIAGTLVEVGRGHIKPEAVAGIIAAKDRAKAGPTAPARGLRLVEIEYRKNQ